MYSKWKRKIKHEKFHYSKITPLHQPLPQYSPASPQAEEFHACQKDIRALFGGNRAGKTEAGAYEMIKLMK